MGKKGKRLPTDLKKQRGTLKGPEPESRVALVPAQGLLDPPGPLRPREHEIFNQICEEMRALGTLSVGFRRPIMHLAILEYRAEVMRRSLGCGFVMREEVKSTAKGARKKEEVKNPALQQLQQLEGMIVRAQQALGLTPEGVVHVPKSSTPKGTANGTGNGHEEGKNPFEHLDA